MLIAYDQSTALCIVAAKAPCRKYLHFSIVPMLLNPALQLLSECKVMTMTYDDLCNPIPADIVGVLTELIVPVGCGDCAFGIKGIEPVNDLGRPGCKMVHQRRGE